MTELYDTEWSEAPVERPRKPVKLSQMIIEENDDWIAINKPSGLLSIPDREGKEVSLKVLLKEKYGDIFTVHRLDKDTSGLIIFAKNEKSHQHLSIQFEERLTQKIYLGLVVGSLSPASGTINESIGENPGQRGVMTVHTKGKPSLTDYEVIDDYKIYSWVRFQIHTGRTHQVRVHAKHVGHPIVCDEIYGDGKPILISSLKKKFKLSKNELNERPILNRLALHASLLSFTDCHQKPIQLEAPLAKDIAATLQQLKKIKG